MATQTPETVRLAPTAAHSVSELEVLLHYYHYKGLFGGVTAIMELQDHYCQAHVNLKGAGLIKETSTGFEIDDRGQALVEVLVRVPLPTKAWRFPS